MTRLRGVLRGVPPTLVPYSYQRAPTGDMWLIIDTRGPHQVAALIGEEHAALTLAVALNRRVRKAAYIKAKRARLAAGAG